MSDLQPSEEQVKKFWEWCGFKFDGDNPSNYIIYSPLYKVGNSEWFNCGHNPLYLDLNNIFKYAVSKASNLDEVELQPSKDSWLAVVWIHNEKRSTGTGLVCSYRDPIKGYGSNPALALFWAIWEVINV